MLKVVCIVKYFCRNFVLVTNPRWYGWTANIDYYIGSYIDIMLVVKLNRAMRLKYILFDI